jgi:hypothetical protein
VSFSNQVEVVDYCPQVEGIYQETLSRKPINFLRKRKCRHICTVYETKTFSFLKLPKQFNKFRGYFNQERISYFKDKSLFKQVSLEENKEFLKRINNYTDLSDENINYHPVLALNVERDSLCLILSSYRGVFVVVSYDIGSNTVSFEQTPYHKLKALITNQSQIAIGEAIVGTKELVNNVLSEYTLNPIYKVPTEQYLKSYANPSE